MARITKAQALSQLQVYMDELNKNALLTSNATLRGRFTMTAHMLATARNGLTMTNDAELVADILESVVGDAALMLGKVMTRYEKECPPVIRLLPMTLAAQFCSET